MNRSELKPVVNIYKVQHDKDVCTIDRSYADTIGVVLPCGYKQRFWMEFTDNQAIEQCKLMKRLGIETD